MSTKVKIGVLAMALIVLSAAAAATAFTSGTVNRQANIDVVADNNGLIGLEDGTSGGLVFQNASDALEIDFAKGSATGVNPSASFELGDPNDAKNKTAFNITNNAQTAKDITVTFNKAGSFNDESDTDANIQFKIYNSAGTLQATVSDESTSATISSVASGATLKVVIVVDTHGLSSTGDLSGNLDISV